MTTISFFAPGEPKGQPRPRAFVFNGQARVYNPAQAESWKSCIAQAAKPFIPAKPLAGPLCVELTFYFVRPGTHYRSGRHADQLKDWAPRYHIQKPDRDNLDKAVLDALSHLRFWEDDDQVADGWIKKLWCPPGLKPGCLITITPLEEPKDDERQPEMFTPDEEKGMLCP